MCGKVVSGPGAPVLDLTQDYGYRALARTVHPRSSVHHCSKVFLSENERISRVSWLLRRTAALLYVADDDGATIVTTTVRVGDTYTKGGLGFPALRKLLGCLYLLFWGTARYPQ